MTKNGTRLSRKIVANLRRDLLSKLTDAEKAAAFYCKRLGYAIILQQPIDTGRKLYFADIYIPEIRTIIECDGGYHYMDTQKRKDANRSSGLWRLGYHVVRLSNHDCRNIEKIKAKINLIVRKQ